MKKEELFYSSRDEKTKIQRRHTVYARLIDHHDTLFDKEWGMPLLQHAADKNDRVTFPEGSVPCRKMRKTVHHYTRFSGKIKSRKILFFCFLSIHFGLVFAGEKHEKGAA